LARDKEAAEMLHKAAVQAQRGEPDGMEEVAHEDGDGGGKVTGGN
jgi:hypothetical protein